MTILVEIKKIITVFISVIILSGLVCIDLSAQSEPGYDDLRREFKSPDYAEWGEVPLWWWEADTITKEKITWQMETLAEKGVKAVNPIQRSPGRSYPASFTDEWWEMIRHTHDEAERLGMHLWLYDQVGYGHYGWLELAAAEVENTGTSRVDFFTAEGNAHTEIRIDLPKGKLLDARGYPVENGTAVDEISIDLSENIQNDVLIWKPDQGQWKVAVSVAVPYRSFYLNEASTDVFLDRLYQKAEDIVGEDAMGKSLRGMFQDEHPPTPRNIYTEELAETFKEKFGYDIGRAIPAQHFDVGKKTPKYRTDYFDAYLSLVEETYWKKVYDWSQSRNILTSHDNWGRRNIYSQSHGYMDYFRTQRWFSAPGMDESRTTEHESHNYYDSKIAASIARIYDRERVWAEVFHSTGWGRTTDQTLTWMSRIFAWGMNLYNEHGLFYSTNTSTWEHAAPDPHWRQPYWEYYQDISDWVARTSYMISQGKHVADVAVHYPAVSLLADLESQRAESAVDYNLYMELSESIYNAGIDNDIIDDYSILNAEIIDGTLRVAGNDYQALVFGPLSTFRISVLDKLSRFVEDGGTVLFYGHLPTASTEHGRMDSKLASALAGLFGVSNPESLGARREEQSYESGGYAAFLPHTPELIPSLLSVHIDRDFVTEGDLRYLHRNIGEVDVYFIQNTEHVPLSVDYRTDIGWIGLPKVIDIRFRVDGVPEIWDAFTGEIHAVDRFQREDGYTRVQLKMDSNIGKLLVFRPGDQQSGAGGSGNRIISKKQLSKDWTFSVIPTLDNQWGDFRWPPSNEKFGPEIRGFKYKEETSSSGLNEGWHKPGFDDGNWKETLYSKGPHWLALEEIPSDAPLVKKLLDDQETIIAGKQVNVNGENFSWEEISFSRRIGVGESAPWGGHRGFPDGHFDKNFIRLKEGRKILFTHIYSPQEQTAGLNIQLNNSDVTLYVNGDEQPCQGAVCNLPLNEGYNHVLLDVPDGNRGMLYVTEDPPVITDIGGEDTDAVLPDLSDAVWIWYGDTDGTYLRKSFEIQELPETAHMVITAVTGYRVFINGILVDEEIGPWANWDYPANINIERYLQKGENTIAVWGQYFSGRAGAPFASEYKAVALAMKAVFDDGSTLNINTDNTWKGHTEEIDDWESSQLRASDWSDAVIIGEVGDDPWGEAFLKNIGSSTTPYRPLSVSLYSPEIEVFNEMPDIIYDIKPASADRIGWYRFEVPPGIKKIKLNTRAESSLWINGNEVSLNEQIAVIEDPPVNVATVAVRLKMQPGNYAGAAFDLPVELELHGGKIQPGPWENYAMPTYSGIGVYNQNIHFTEEEAGRSVELNLGDVRVAAEVFVNGKSAGVRVAKPFKFDLTDFIKSGDNEFEIRVANTLAPHYSYPDLARNLGPVKSGLIGPVSLYIYAK